jgi:phenylacetate-CoA ligase
LTKEAMPVIRYRTRDLTRLLPGTARPGFRRMQKITGRSDDMIILRGVNVFPSQVEEQILRVPHLAPHYQLVLTREGPLDAMAVVVEAEPGASSAEREAAARMLAHHVKEMIGVTAAVNVRDPGAIERSLGKARRVVDRRPK